MSRQSRHDQARNHGCRHRRWAWQRGSSTRPSLLQPRLRFEPLEDRRLLALANPFDLDLLYESNGSDGTSGFVVTGVAQGDRLGSSVRNAGDVDGDGYEDLIIGAFGTDVHAEFQDGGAAYLVFGSPERNHVELNAADIPGAAGMTIFARSNFDSLGFSVDGAGDINGDGYHDIIVGAHNALNPDGVSHDGQAYVIFGAPRNELPATLTPNDLVGLNGFTITSTVGGQLGYSVAGAGDVNGDGYDDLIVGDQISDPDAFVLFGRSDSFSAMIDVADLDGTNGFALDYPTSGLSGVSVDSAGDVNGDGYHDMVVAGQGSFGGMGNQGLGFVVFGSPTLPTEIDLSQLSGNDGFLLTGLRLDSGAGGTNGASVSSAGDIDGDGLDDLIIGGVYESQPGGGGEGAAYVLFGKASGFAPMIVAPDIGSPPGDFLVLAGTDANENVGRSVSGAGDINSDGYDDLVVGVSNANTIGQAFVVLGSADLGPGTMVQDDLDGHNGYRIDPPEGGRLVGWSVSGAGDVNGDGFNDLIVGGKDSRVPPSGPQTGHAYVIYGKPDDVVYTDELDGANGFVVNGIDPEDLAGYSVDIIGDVNDDGIDDVAIGAPEGDPNGSRSGELYVVFGSGSGFPAELDADSLDGSDGFVIHGGDQFHSAGYSVGRAGDFNDDGIGDMILGAPFANPGDRDTAGQAYVVFGRSSGDAFPAVLELTALDGNNGLTLNGIAGAGILEGNGDLAGSSVGGAGDVNNDGIDDVIVGAPDVTIASLNREDAGESYVVFGGDTLPAVIELADVGNSIAGVKIQGASNNDGSGAAVGRAGDVNGDGFADVIVGAPVAGSGESYVVFGGPSLPSTVDLAALDGTDGFTVDGKPEGLDDDGLGLSVDGAGDVNADGFGDVIIGAPKVDTDDSPGTYIGEAYVVFGKETGFASVLDAEDLDGSNGFAVQGVGSIDGFTLLRSISVGGAGDVNADGYGDVIVSAQQYQPLPSPAAPIDAKGVVVFGKAGGFPATLGPNSLNGANGYVILTEQTSDSGYELDVSGGGDVNGDGVDDLVIGDGYEDVNGMSDEGRAFVVFGERLSVGYEGPDVLLATTSGESIIGGRDADVLYGDGPDVLRGGRGSDTITLNDLEFRRLDGGTGYDTLIMSGVGGHLDLVALANNRVTGIEEIDISPANNVLSLNLLDVLALSDTSNRLLVRGNVDDTVHIGAGWTEGLSVIVDGFVFEVYTQLGATLLIQQDVTIGPGANFLAGDYNLNGTVDAADYTVYRDMLGQTGLALYSGADGNGDGKIDQDDYDVWVDHFGETLMMGSGAGGQGSGAGGDEYGAGSGERGAAEGGQSPFSTTLVAGLASDAKMGTDPVAASVAPAPARGNVPTFALDTGSTIRPPAEPEAARLVRATHDGRDAGLLAWLASRDQSWRRVEDVDNDDDTFAHQADRASPDLPLDSMDAVFESLLVDVA